MPLPCCGDPGHWIFFHCIGGSLHRKRPLMHGRVGGHLPDPFLAQGWCLLSLLSETQTRF